MIEVEMTQMVDLHPFEVVSVLVYVAVLLFLGTLILIAPRDVRILRSPRIKRLIEYLGNIEIE
jgi:hypothetical protein